MLVLVCDVWALVPLVNSLTLQRVKLKFIKTATTNIHSFLTHNSSVPLKCCHFAAGFIYKWSVRIYFITTSSRPLTSDLPINRSKLKEYWPAWISNHCVKGVLDPKPLCFLCDKYIGLGCTELLRPRSNYMSDIMNQKFFISLLLLFCQSHQSTPLQQKWL